MPNEYYVICDSNQSIIAIHRVYDSAVACYDHFVKHGTKGISIVAFGTNQYGIVMSEMVVKTTKPKLTAP